MSLDGTIVEAAGSELRDRPIGDFVTVTFSEGETVLDGFTRLCYEIPYLKPSAPKDVVDIVFNKDPSEW